MSNKTNITSNGTTLLETTQPGHPNVSIIVTSGSSLGSGTLTIRAKPEGVADADYETLFSGTLVAGDQYVYEVGERMDVAAVLSGASSPDIDIIHSQGS